MVNAPIDIPNCRAEDLLFRLWTQCIALHFSVVAGKYCLPQFNKSYVLCLLGKESHRGEAGLMGHARGGIIPSITLANYLSKATLVYLFLQRE